MADQNSSNIQTNIYWSKLFNRVERALGWFFFVTGLVILISYALYELVLSLFENTQLSLFVKVGIFFIIIGFVILLISIIRERIVLSKKDKYSEVEQ